MGRLTGSLSHAYAVTVPADPGWSQPARHRADAPGGGTDRDDAPAGGGWQPYGWDDQPAREVLTGETWGEAPSHYGDGVHTGPAGRGASPRPAEELANPDNLAGTGCHGLADLDHAGSSGAANGGLSATGVSAPWANGPVVRRRADGQLIARAGGLDLGTTYTPAAETHRQGLHFNRPKIRGVRLTAPVVERSSPSPGGDTSPYNPITRPRTFGPVSPRMRRILRPYGQTDYVDSDTDPAGSGSGVIAGDEWVQ